MPTALPASLTHVLFAALVCAISLSSAYAADPRLKTRNVFLIMTDGLRWQEVFSGAEEQLLNKTNGGVSDVKATRSDYWRATPEERRQALMPFMWSEIARRGQIIGNPKRGSSIRVANGLKFSYPGYNEICAGIADPRIQSNDKKPNPNVTVFEWLNGHTAFTNRVALFATWDVFPYIFNVERSRLPLWPPWEERFADPRIHPPQHVLDLMEDTTSLWSILIFDSMLHHVSLDHVRREKPRVAFIGYGETDEWAHEGRYDLYLQSARHVDRFVRVLWETLQSMPEYRDQTTLLITADHGRGGGPKSWKDHGEKVEGAEDIWLAALGPDIPALGERKNTQPATQAQIAATLAALMGEDFNAASTNSARPLLDVLGVPARR